MPRRDESLEAFWLDPGLPHLEGDESLAAPTGANDVPNEAVLIITDKIGFKYERRARLQDFVSQREAAKLLGVPVMTVHRWVKAKLLPAEARRGYSGKAYSVVRLAEVLRVAKERNLLDEERIRTRVRTGSPTDADYSGFTSELSTSENMYVRFHRVDQKRSRGRGRDAAG